MGSHWSEEPAAASHSRGEGKNLLHPLCLAPRPPASRHSHCPLTQGRRGLQCRSLNSERTHRARTFTTVQKSLPETYSSPHNLLSLHTSRFLLFFIHSSIFCQTYSLHAFDLPPSPPKPLLPRSWRNGTAPQTMAKSLFSAHVTYQQQETADPPASFTTRPGGDALLGPPALDGRGSSFQPR